MHDNLIYYNNIEPCAVYTVLNCMCTNAVDKHSEWVEGSKLKEAFLVEGQQKQFTCTSFGNLK